MEIELASVWHHRKCKIHVYIYLHGYSFTSHEAKMNGQCLVSALLLALTIIPHSLCLESNSYYTKRFAVQIKGGNERATSVAEIHGMKNLGLVSILWHR